MPIRPSSPAEMSDALLGIDKLSQDRSTDFYDSIYKMASTLEKLDSLSRSDKKFGTASRPAVTQTKMSYPTGMLRSNSLVTPGASPGLEPLLQPMEGTPETRVVKPGVPGTVGSDELEIRKYLLPFISNSNKSSAEINNDIKLLLTEPDFNKAVNDITFGPKNSESDIVLSKELASALRTAGFDATDGQVMTSGDYKRMLAAARLKFSVERETRLKSTVGLDLSLKQERLKQQKSRTKKAEAEAAINEAISAAFPGSGDAGIDSSDSGQTSSGTKFKIVR